MLPLLSSSHVLFLVLSCSLLPHAFLLVFILLLVLLVLSCSFCFICSLCSRAPCSLTLLPSLDPSALDLLLPTDFIVDHNMSLLQQNTLTAHRRWTPAYTSLNVTDPQGTLKEVSLPQQNIRRAARIWTPAYTSLKVTDPQGTLKEVSVQ